MKHLCSTTLLILSLGLPAQADWQLMNEQSSLNFASIKKHHIYETHRFDSLAGRIDDSGSARLEIDLTSVNTGIQIRDERMRELLFQVGANPRALFTTHIDPAALQGLQPGDSTRLQVAGELQLHRIVQPLQAELVATRLKNGRLQVHTLQPLVVSADKFALDGGVEALRVVANLAAISLAVPVNFTLTFEQQE